MLLSQCRLEEAAYVQLACLYNDEQFSDKAVEKLRAMQSKGPEALGPGFLEEFSMVKVKEPVPIDGQQPAWAKSILARR
eukprot:7082425-Lingulodinium_polyedra.AAC.1